VSVCPSVRVSVCPSVRSHFFFSKRLNQSPQTFFFLKGIYLPWFKFKDEQNRSSGSGDLVEELSQNMDFRGSMKLLHKYLGKLNAEIVHIGLKLKISVWRNWKNVSYGNQMSNSGTRVHGVAHFPLLGHKQKEVAYRQYCVKYEIWRPTSKDKIVEN